MLIQVEMSSEPAEDRKRRREPGSSPRLVVVTGGPGTGKTSIIEALAARGFATVPEAAIEVIAELNAELGLEEQKRWRQEHRREFQERVLERQLALEERAAASDADVVFLDRSRIDGLAYCSHFGQELPDALRRAARAARYDDVVLLEQLATFPERSGTGRTSGREASIALGGAIETVYRELGYEPIWLADGTVAERTDELLRILGLPRGPS